jgi:hypothetical protein
MIVLWDIGCRICDDKLMLMIFDCIYDYEKMVDKNIYVIVLWDIGWRIVMMRWCWWYVVVFLWLWKLLIKIYVIELWNVGLRSVIISYIDMLVIAWGWKTWCWINDLSSMRFCCKCGICWKKDIWDCMCDNMYIVWIL